MVVAEVVQAEEIEAPAATNKDVEEEKETPKETTAVEEVDKDSDSK